MIVSVLRRLSVSIIHRGLSIPATHGRLSHPLAAGADGIGLFTDRYRLAGGSDLYGILLALLQIRTAIQEGVKALCGIRGREDFFAVCVCNCDAFSCFCILIQIINDAGLGRAVFIESLEHARVSAGKDGSSCDRGSAVIINGSVSAIRRTVYDNCSAGYVQVSIGVDSVSARDNLDFSSGDIDRDVYRGAVFRFSGTVNAVIRGLNGNIAPFYVHRDPLQTFIGFLDIDGSVFYRKRLICMKRIVSCQDGHLTVFHRYISLGMERILYGRDPIGAVLHRQRFLPV